jgi:hypothetical protein
MAEEMESYRGYRLEISAAKPGWQVLVYAPGGTSAHPNSPVTDDPSGKDLVIAQAKAILDSELDSPPPV